MVDRKPTRKPSGGLTEGVLLNRMTNRIWRSLELEEILAATVAEVRSFLGTDRVKIYRFQPDGSGQVIAEAVQRQRLPSLLHLFFPAGDIPPAARELFIKARLRSIVDVSAQTITLSQMDHPLGTAELTVEAVETLPLERILQRPLDPCHVQYLTSMGVQSSLVIPILHQQNLWGLLVSHHATPKRFSKQKLQIVQLVTEQVSIAIAQSDLLSKMRARAQREAAINQISTLLHSPLPMHEILQTVLEQIVTVVPASSGRLYLFPVGVDAAEQIYTVGQQPLLPEPNGLLETSPYWRRLMPHVEVAPICGLPRDWSVAAEPVNQGIFPAEGEIDTSPVTIADLYQEPLLAEWAPGFRPTRLRSLLIMPLCYGNLPLGFLSIFRDAIDTDIVWAGKFDPEERNQQVRESFEAWREIKREQAQAWLPEDVELVRSLGIHLIMAIMQIRLYECEREQRLLVEIRNRELNSARSAAESASRLKSDFLSSTSHELRTPLASTLNYLKLLKEGFYDNPDELQEYINVAYHSAENLVAIINDVLDIAKIEAGRMQVHWEQVDLSAMLREQEHLFRPESRQKGIPITIDCQVKHVWADKLKLRQILTNLLANAFKFTTAGAIEVRATYCDLENSDLENSDLENRDNQIGDGLQSVVEISITDTGIGIDPARRNLLFEPFVQGNGSIKRRYGGTGLGLTICKRLVELMGGQIWMESAGKDQGTTVIFRLPKRSTDYGQKEA